MLTKEKGYEEFLSEKITRGRQDGKTGRTVELAQLKTEVYELIEQKAVEFQKNELNPRAC